MALVDILSDHATTGLETGAQLAKRLNARTSGEDGLIAVARALAPLFGSAGLERGHVYACAGDASMSLLYSLVAPATQNGLWFAMVDLARAGLMAAHEQGVALHRTLCVSSGNNASWARVVGALVDGVDLVAVAAPTCSLAHARQITARVKAQGSVLLIVGQPGAFSVDATFTTRTSEWQFDTYARSRSVSVVATGRRVHGQRSCVVQLPSAGGAVSV